MRHIFLDSHPLSALSNPKPSVAEVAQIKRWAAACLNAGHELYLPEVIDCELRRELVRAGRAASVANLNALKVTLRYVPLTTDAMLLAADLWAQARQSGQPTSDPKKLDIDVILAAQALSSGVDRSGLIVATGNPAHLARFVAAAVWQDILP